MLRNVRPLAPIVVLATFNAVPVVVVMVLTMVVLFCVADTVPPPVAVKPGLVVVLSARPPVKLMVDPVFAFRNTPWPVSVIAPLKADRAAGAVLDVDRSAGVAADGRRGGERHRDVALVDQHFGSARVE